VAGAAVAIGVMGGQVVGAAGVTAAVTNAPDHTSVPVHRASGGTGHTTAPPIVSGSRAGGLPTSIPASLGVAPTGPPAFLVAPGTEAQVAQDLIAAIDAQSNGAYAIAATPDNLTLIESWMANEGGLWADNPLNTSLGTGRYPHQITTGGQDTGIPIFPDIATGIGATAKTLLSNPAYAAILAVLGQGDAACGTFARAVIDSPWAASHYGHDPSRFCGSTGGAGTVPLTTACLRLPDRGKRSALRAAREPGACGHFATHGSRSGGRATKAGHGSSGDRPTTHGGGVRRTRSHQRAGLRTAPSAQTTETPWSFAHTAPARSVVRVAGRTTHRAGGRRR
jgi:hypothetical protein